MSLSPDQFKYLVEDNPGNASMEVKAYHPETEREVGSLTVKVREFGRGRAPMTKAKEPQIRGAFVHPDFQQRGVGTELYDIATHHLGKAPMHDTSVTPQAQAWAAKVGGALHPEMKTGVPYSDEEMRRGFEQHRTRTYSQHLEEGAQPPKSRQLSFRGV